MVRVRAFAGVAGPVVFTAAWVAGSLRQTGYGALSVQLSGLAADGARDPWIMTTGFLALGGPITHHLPRRSARHDGNG